MMAACSRILTSSRWTRAAGVLICGEMPGDEARRYAGPNAIGYAKFFSRSHYAVICAYDEAGNVIATHEHAGSSKARNNQFSSRSPLLLDKIAGKLRNWYELSSQNDSRGA